MLPDATLFLPVRLARPDAGEQGFYRLAAALTDNFNLYRGHVVVAAAGIVFRILAPLIQAKTSDPGVVVLDQEGRYAVSLLAGHLGGGNELARTVADILGGRAVITTATDSAGKPALEMIARNHGLALENLAALSRIGRAVLEGEIVPLFDPGDWLAPWLQDWPESFARLEAPPAHNPDRPLIWVGPQALDFPSAWLLIRPPVLAVGLGCKPRNNPG